MEVDPKKEDKKDTNSKDKKDTDAEKKTQDEGSKGKGFSNPFMKPNEVIELNPIDELSQVISTKKLLSR